MRCWDPPPEPHHHVPCRASIHRSSGQNEEMITGDRPPLANPSSPPALVIKRFLHPSDTLFVLYITLHGQKGLSESITYIYRLFLIFRLLSFLRSRRALPPAGLFTPYILIASVFFSFYISCQYVYSQDQRRPSRGRGRFAIRQPRRRRCPWWRNQQRQWK